MSERCEAQLLPYQQRLLKFESKPVNDYVRENGGIIPIDGVCVLTARACDHNGREQQCRRRVLQDTCDTPLASPIYWVDIEDDLLG